MEIFQKLTSSFFLLMELIMLVFSIYYYLKSRNKEGILLIAGSSLIILNTPIFLLMSYFGLYSESISMFSVYNIIIIRNLIELTGKIIFTFGFVLLILKQFKAK